MSQFSIIITRSPFKSGAHQSAIRFIQACYQSGHQIATVFFYGDATLVANKACLPFHQHPSLTQQWGKLSTQHGFTLQACVSAATLRGIVDKDERLNRPDFSLNIADNFNLVGLGELAQISQQTDKIIEFNG